jgi:hypothetical protein
MKKIPRLKMTGKNNRQFLSFEISYFKSSYVTFIYRKCTIFLPFQYILSNTTCKSRLNYTVYNYTVYNYTVYNYTVYNYTVYNNTVYKVY